MTTPQPPEQSPVAPAPLSAFPAQPDGDHPGPGWAAPPPVGAPPPPVPGAPPSQVSSGDLGPAAGSAPEWATPADVVRAAAPASRWRRRPVLAAGVAGLLAGAVVVGAVWLGTALDGRADTGASAADDAAAACGIFQRLPDTWPEETFTRANTARVAAAAALAVAAAEDDTRFRELAAEAQRTQQAVNSFQLDGIATQVRVARKHCDEL